VPGEGQSASKNRFIAPLVAGGLVVIALGGSAGWESNIYFGRQAASVDVQRGFNATENGVAHETIAALGAGEDVYLAPDFFSYAPVRFLVYGVIKAATGENTLDDRPYRAVLPQVNLPLPDSGRDVLMLLNTDFWPMRDFITLLYPGAEMELVQTSYGLPIYMRVNLPQEQVAALQGLTERRTYADGRQEERVVSEVDLSAAEAEGADVEWDGSIRVEHGGEYEIKGAGGVQVFIDGKPWEGSHYLGQGLYGLHLVRLREAEGDAGLSWQTAEGDPAPVPAESLYRVPGFQQGLLGTYWANMNWEGAPVFQQITPMLYLAWPNEQPIVPNGPFSARYTGMLHVEEAGNYLLRLNMDDGGRLILDGQTLGEWMEAGKPNTFDATLDLAAGDHPIEIDYFQQGGGTSLKFYWSKDGGEVTPVPPTALIPASP
jgi:hypothetical protein